MQQQIREVPGRAALQAFSELPQLIRAVPRRIIDTFTLASARAARAAAMNDGLRTALMLLDIDHFKRVNDTHGHDVGDEVLIDIAQRLSAGLKEYDVACRRGGEELLVLLVFHDPATLKGIAERLRTSIEERPLSAHGLNMTVSGGLTVRDWDEDLHVAVQRADALMYKAKAAGRNRIESDVGG